MSASISQGWVAGADIERDEAQMHRRCAGRHAERVLGPDVLGEGGLEAVGLRSSRQPPRAQRVQDLGLLFEPEARPMEGQKAVAHRSSALDDESLVMH